MVCHTRPTDKDTYLRDLREWIYNKDSIFLVVKTPACFDPNPELANTEGLIGPHGDVFEMAHFLEKKFGCTITELPTELQEDEKFKTDPKLVQQCGKWIQRIACSEHAKNIWVAASNAYLKLYTSSAHDGYHNFVHAHQTGKEAITGEPEPTEADDRGMKRRAEIEKILREQMLKPSSK